MSEHHGPDIATIIRQVRRRWRLRLALRGATTVLAVGVGLLVAAAFGLRWTRFDPSWVNAFRAAIAVVFGAVVGVFLVRPLLRKVTDQQVARYIEEHEPSLDSALLSALEHTESAQAAPPRDASHSAALVARLIESTVEKCFATQAARQADQQKLARSAAAVATVVLLAIGIFGAGPAYLRDALSTLFLFSKDVQAAVPRGIAVTPGNVTVPKGADQTVAARLAGFDVPEAMLLLRRTPGADFERLPLVRNDKGLFEGMLFDVKGPVEYLVEADGVRSATYALKVVDLPYVDTLRLEFHFPAYTALDTEVVENGGDIAVLTGTQVRVAITPTMKTPGGRVLVDDRQSLPLKVEADGTLTAAFRVERDGSYRVELDAPTGEKVAASPQYTIDALTDEAPRVSFAKPGRDTTASPIEEVFVEATAVDDFGVRNLELVYSVNGGPEKTKPLFAGTKRMPQVSAGHTFYLEELGVQAGDAVSYYARAMDNSNAGGHQTTSDLYFVRVRPFKKDFRAAQSQAGGGGGGGMQGGVDALSEQQRQVIAATFNVQRDRKRLSAEKLKEHAIVVALSQSRLREQVEGLVTRMTSRFLEPDPAFKKITELLPKAIAEMKTAEGQLTAVSPDGALPAEHRALGLLQKAEEEYETQVSMSKGGGGGGGGSAVSKELAEMFEMDLDKLANQYETADRANQQSSDQQVDELMEKLKELARRQEQEAEAQRRRAMAGQAGSGGSSGSQQRQLAEQAEEAARRLERLSREQKRQDLADAAKQMRDVAEAMRKAASGGGGGTGQAQAKQALDRLREAEKKLRRGQADRARRDIDDARQQAEELARAERDIAEGVRALPGKAGEERRQAISRLNEQKQSLDERAGQLERGLDRSAGDAARDEKEASRKLTEAAGAIRDSRLRDKVRYSRQMLGRASKDTMDAVEEDITESIEGLRKKLDQAAAAVGQGKPEQDRNDAVDRAQRLARGLESLGQRTREKMQRGAEQAAKDGQQAGMAGQGTANSQQAGQGKAGQRGQQGQGQKGQGQQGKGQSGQSGQGGEQGQASGGQQGEGGQSGQGGQQAGGNGAMGGGRAGAEPGLGGIGQVGPWDGSSFSGLGRLDPEDIRQLRGEARQWTAEAAELRARMRAENIDPRELDEILKKLRQLDDQRVYQDAKTLASLQSDVTEGLKRVEYALRRKTEAEKDVALSGADPVPDAFRPLVEQYYRSLSKNGGK